MEFTIYNNAFKNIDSENTAYWIGFLAADGSVKADRNRLMLGLAQRDKLHIEKFKKFINADEAITDRNVLCGNNGKRYPSSSITISSKLLVDDLAQYGIVSDKSHQDIDFLQYIPEKYKIFFILGFFDGDGYFVFTKKTNGFGWCGSQSNINSIMNYVKQYFSLTTTARCQRDKKSLITYSFSDYKIKDIKVFCEFYLSQSNKVDLLERKAETAKQLLDFINNKINTSILQIKTNGSIKRNPKKIAICEVCKKNFYVHSESLGKYCSQECVHIAQRRVERPSRDELKKLIRNMPFLQIGIKYGVSDNAVRRWCKAENLPFKTTIIKNISDEEWEKI